MRLLLYTAPTPPEDLALEEAIQLGMEEGSSPSTWQKRMRIGSLSR